MRIANNVFVATGRTTLCGNFCLRLRYPPCSSVASKVTSSATVRRTKPSSVAVSVLSTIWATTLPVREIAPMMAVLCAVPRLCVFLFQWRLLSSTTKESFVDLDLAHQHLELTATHRCT